MRTRIALQPEIIQSNGERQGGVTHPCTFIAHHVTHRFPLTDVHDSCYSYIVSNSGPQPNKYKSPMKNQTSFTDSFEIASLKKHDQQIDSLQQLQQDEPGSIIKVFAGNSRSIRVFHKCGCRQYKCIESRQYIH